MNIDKRYPASACLDYSCVKKCKFKVYEFVPDAYRQNLEIIINQKVKLMLNLPMRMKCTLTDSVTLERLVQTLKTLGKSFK